MAAEEVLAAGRRVCDLRKRVRRPGVIAMAYSATAGDDRMIDGAGGLCRWNHELVPIDEVVTFSSRGESLTEET